jgi:UTP--glucose-1-phosphate uridylyltransferase
VRLVIPAAGIGKRFLPLTSAVPKELLPLGEYPLIHHALVEAEAAGFDSVTIVISPAKRSIRKYFEPDRQLQRWLEARGDEQGLATLKAVYGLAARLKLDCLEQPAAGGVGEAVLMAAKRLDDAPFGVLLPDDVVTSVGHWQSLIALHQAFGAAVLCVREVSWEEVDRFGVAVCRREGDVLRVQRLVEKPQKGEVPSNLAIFGRYVVTGSVVQALRRAHRDHHGELQLTDGYAGAAGGPPGVVAFEFKGDFYDNGTPADYLRSVKRFGSKEN